MSLLPVAEAQALLLAGLAPIYREEVTLQDAAGRTLDSDHAARVNQPPHDLSAMDGFAVRATDCTSVPVTLPVKIYLPAGEMPAWDLKPGEAARVFTGSVMPKGADSVVIQEDTTYTDKSVTVNEAPKPGRHVRKAGMDFKTGDVLLRAGTRLSYRHVALAAAMNLPTLNVHACPDVAIISSGSELVAPGATPAPGKIIASNGIALAAAVRQWGGAPQDSGIIPDDPGALKKALFRAAGADLIVTSGGASVGDFDYVQEAILANGGTIDFWRIAMKPGKPLMVGKLGRATVIGLPGNPVSALVCAELFLRPAIAALMGRPDPLPKPRIGVAATALPTTTTRQEYIRARSEIRDGAVHLTPTTNQDSSALSALAAADSLIIRPKESPEIAPGAPIQYLPLD